MTKNQKDSVRHCCPKMNNYADIESSKYKFIEYESYMKAFSVQIFDHDETRQRLFYCPWCGKKFSKALDHEWKKILEKEYGLTLTYDEMIEGSKVPEDFKTDKWWKDRGL